MKFSKKLLSLLLCAVMVLGSVAVGGEGFVEAISNVFDAISVKASAEEVENSGTYGTNITWNLSDDGVLTISGTGNMPESYFSSDVPWLYSSIQIKTIVIVSGVTNIGALAFAGCDALTSITIPNSVTSICFSAFLGCTSLTKITVDPNNQYYSSDEYGVLFNKSRTELIKYPAGKVTIIYTIPDSVTSIDEYAFSGCCNLTSITIPDSVKSIDEGAFEECTNLISVTLPNGLKTIESETFFNCINLTNVIIPDSVESIGASAFENCMGLKSVIIPNSVKSIGSCAFNHCIRIESITISDNVTDIEVRVFGDCENLKDVYVYCDSDVEDVKVLMEPYDIDNFTLLGHEFENNVCKVCGITEFDIENGVLYEYNGNGGDVVIPDGVTSLMPAVFSYCTSMTSITIPEGVTSIRNHTFASCTNLSSVKIPNSVTSIGNHAFYNCTSLPSIVIPNSVTSIENNAFYFCTNLTSVTISDKVTSMGTLVFYMCNNLKDVYIPCDSDVETVKGIMQSYGDYTYTQLDHNFVDGACTVCGVKEFVIENGVLVEYNGNGGDVVIPDGVTSLMPAVFSYCTSMTSVTIPEGVTSIRNHTFASCTNLSSVKIPNSVTSIGNHAFYNCTSLPSIVIPNSVTSIENNAFYFCTNLTSVTISDKVTSMGTLVFYMCNNLKDVYIPCDSDVEAVKDLMEPYDIVNFTQLGHEFENNVCKVCGITEFVIENGVLIGYNGKYGDIVIPDEVTKIEENLFADNQSITSVRMPNVTEVGSEAFRDCFNLTSAYMPKVEILESEAFSGCFDLSSVNMPNVRIIGDCVFKRCKFKSIDVSKAESIGNSAFYKCEYLTDITMNSGVGLGVDVFFSSSNIETVYCTCGSDADVLKEKMKSYGDLTYIQLEHNFVDFVCTACGAEDTAGKLAKAKADAKTAIEAAAGENYSVVVSQLVGLGLRDVQLAETLEKVNTVKENSINAIKTQLEKEAAAKALADAKTAAIAEINAAKTEANATIAEKAITDINAATSVDDVNTIKTKALADMVKADADATAAKALADAKTAAIAEINAAKTEDNKAIAEKAITEINAATKVDDVATIKTKALNDMVKADADAAAAKALAEAKTAAIAAIEAAKTEYNADYAEAAKYMINTCETVEAVNHQKELLLEDMARIDADERAAVAEAKADAIAEIENVKTGASFAIAAKAVTDIEAATSVDDVNTIKTKALADMAKADEDAAYGKALTAAKDEALEAVDSAKEAAISDAAKNVSIYPIFNAVTLEEVAAAKAEALNAIAAAEKALADAKTAAKTDLAAVKNNAVSDEAKAVIDTAIENVDKATNPDAVASAKAEGTSNAVNADKSLADAKAAAKTELETAKNNAVSDEAKAAIDTAIENVDKATNSDAVASAKAEGTRNAENADNAYAEKIKFDNVNIKAAGAQTVDYRSIVTIKATATGVPEGYKLAIYLGSQKVAEGDNKSVSYEYGEIKSDINYTVKVIDANGKVQKDSNGNELSKDGGKITCNAGFFKKLIAFFKGLFKSLPKVEVKP